MKFAVETWTINRTGARTVLMNIPVISRVEAICIAGSCALSLFSEPGQVERIIRHNWNEGFRCKNFFDEEVEILVVAKEPSDELYNLPYGVHNYSDSDTQDTYPV